MVATEADVVATAVETEVVVTVAEATVAEEVTAEADTAEEADVMAEEADVMADAVDVMADVVATAEAEAEVKNPATVAKAETDVQVVIQATDDEVQVDLNKKRGHFQKNALFFWEEFPTVRIPFIDTYFIVYWFHH